MGRHLGWYLKFLLFVFSFLLLHNSGVSAQVQSRVNQAVDADRRVTLEGNVHPMARAEFDRGVAEASQPMPRMLLLLKRSDAQQAALLSLMEQQQDKSSPNYHAWLTPQDFGARFGPADADIQAVTEWLASQGFAVDRVYSGRTVIEFSGNVAQVQQAFRADIRKYEVDDKLYLANAQNPQIPAALAPVVEGIVSLNNFPRISHARYRGVARKISGHAGLQPLYTFPLPSGSDFYGVGPGDFATIYNSRNLIAGGNDGTGQTIAVVGETNINVQDVTDFRALFGLPANFSASNIILNGEDPGITSVGEEGEADLDVQWSGAAAPGATIKFVVSASTPASAGIDLSALYIVEHNLAGVMSESYGACETNLGSAANGFYNATWEQAAAQGITVIVSSGDGGSAGCDNFNSQAVATRGLAVSGLAGTPFNVSVGGTDFDQRANPLLYWNPSSGNSPTGSSAKSYIPEIPWNESCAQISFTGCGVTAPTGSINIVAGSGGQSSVYHKPLWQTGVTGVPSGDHRYQPDISLFASPGFNNSGYIVCQQDRNISGFPACDLNTNSSYLDFHIFGGTSASAPAFAGVMALVNQYQAAHGGSGRQGNANYVLYALAKQSGASCPSSATEATTCIFNDVTRGSSDLPGGGVGLGTISVPCKGGTLNCSVAVAASTGVLVDPARTTTEAWTTNAGYDLATGLGSVNVANLATKWRNASTVATTTALTLSPQTGITHGTNENVTVNVTVKPTTGIAKGDVSLIAQLSGATTTQGIDQFTLDASGAISNLPTNSLPGGSYNVIAHYSGDGTNAPSDSAPVAVTVAKESSKVLIEVPTFDSNGQTTNVNASTLPYGSLFFLRMYVTDSLATLGTDGFPTPFCAIVNVVACPTGTITLTDNGSPVDQSTFTLNNNGYTRDLSPSTATFTGGTHVLQAVYSGDNSFTTSTGTDTITVTPAVTKARMYLPGPGVVLGNALGLDLQLMTSVFGVAPTGTVQFFYDGSNPLTLDGPISFVGRAGYSPYNPAYADAYASALLSTAGTHTITAAYSGDGNYQAVTSDPVTVSVIYPTSLSISESSINIPYGQPVTITAKITTTGKNPPITGIVQFYGSSTPIPGPVTSMLTVDGNGNQTITASVTTTPQSSEYVNVQYSGDSNFAGASGNSDVITVDIPDFILGPPNGVSVVPIAGQSGSAQITVTPVSQTPSTVALWFPPLVMSGYNISLSPHQVNLNGAPVTATISLTPVGGMPVPAARNQARHMGFLPLRRLEWWSVSLTMSLMAVFLLCLPRHRRTLKPALGLLTGCVFTFVLGCGGGGGTGGGVGGGELSPTVVSLATSKPKVAQNTLFLITATVTGSKPISGTITFYNYGVPVSGPNQVIDGMAQTGTGYLNNPGLYQITASYSGDASNFASNSTPLMQVITGTLPVTLQGSTGGDSHYLQVVLGVQ